MGVVNLLVGFLGSAWEYLLIPFVIPIAILSFAGLLGYVFRKNITKSQRQLQKLKAQVDELSQRLQSIETMTAAVAVELSGPGPFRLPLLTQFKSLVTEFADWFVTEFESQDGKQIYASIPYLVAAQLVNDDVSVPLQKVTLDPSTLIDWAKPADAFRLPIFSSYEGYFYPGRETRILVFLTQEGRRVFVALSAETYDKLLRQLEAALPYQQPNSGAEVGLGPVRYPIRSRL